MAALTHTYHPPYPLRLVIAKKIDHIIEALIPRRCMVISVSLFISGLAIPLLMVMGLLPAIFPIGLAGFALTATGGVLALTLCGEI